MLESTQTNRIFGDNTLDSKMIDVEGLEKRSTGRGKPLSNTMNVITNIYNKSVKRLGNLSDVTADALISTPDKLIMRPIWFGSFTTEFQNLTGKKPDFQKIAANDETYMNENKASLQEATKFADTNSTRAGATDNPFMGILKGQPQSNQGIMLKAFNNFNNFMTRFYSSYCNKSLSRKRRINTNSRRSITKRCNSSYDDIHITKSVVS